MPPLLIRVHLIIRNQAPHKKLKQRGDLLKGHQGILQKLRAENAGWGLGKVEIIRQPLSRSLLRVLCHVSSPFISAVLLLCSLLILAPHNGVLRMTLAFLTTHSGSL